MNSHSAQTLSEISKSMGSIIYCDSDEDEEWEIGEDGFAFDDDEWDEDVSDDVTYTCVQQETKKMVKENIPFIYAGNSITVYMDNEVYIFPNSHLLFNEVVRAVRDGNVSAVRSLIEKRSYKGLEIGDNVILYNGEPLHGVAVERLFSMKALGFDITPMVKFLENCQLNPYPEIVAKLYDFLESKGMPLTEDGCFLGYKYCNKDYFDSHTGKTVQYLPNTVVSVPREDYKDVTGHECASKGLHVGNWEYSGVGNQRNTERKHMVVKVNPKDVLSVPAGSNAKKIRVWEMFVVKEILESSDKLSDDVVTSSGIVPKYKVGDKLVCLYKDGDGKEIKFSGKIKNIGEVYLELEAGWTSTPRLNNTNGRWSAVKTRLKIANITETF